jgi:hypothetical protein
LEITRYYEELLSSKENAFLGRMLTAETDRSKALAKVSHLLRMAIRSANGEREDDGDEEVVCEGRGYNFGAPSEDWSLEREIELERLEKENEELRLLLRLSQGTTNEEDESRCIGAVRNAHVSLPRNRSLVAQGFVQSLQRTNSS